MPGGSCPTVGVAGLALGGGVGFLGRAFGTLSDNLVALTMVTVDGGWSPPTDATNPDLLWASQGGGGGNFGVVTELVLRTHPVGDVVHLRADLAVGADRQGGGRLVRLARRPARRGVVDAVVLHPGHLEGHHPGVRGQGPGHRARRPGRGAPGPADRRRRRRPDRAKRRRPHLARVGGALGRVRRPLGRPVPNPRGRPGGHLPRSAYKAKSDYVAAALPPEAVEHRDRLVERRQADPTLTGAGADFMPGGIEFDSYGGALNAPAPTRHGVRAP